MDSQSEQTHNIPHENGGLMLRAASPSQNAMPCEQGENHNDMADYGVSWSGSSYRVGSRAVGMPTASHHQEGFYLSSDHVEDQYRPHAEPSAPLRQNPFVKTPFNGPSSSMPFGHSNFSRGPGLNYQYQETVRNAECRMLSKTPDANGGDYWRDSFPQAVHESNNTEVNPSSTWTQNLQQEVSGAGGQPLRPLIPEITMEPPSELDPGCWPPVYTPPVSPASSTSEFAVPHHSSQTLPSVGLRPVILTIGNGYDPASRENVGSERSIGYTPPNTPDEDRYQNGATLERNKAVLGTGNNPGLSVVGNLAPDRPVPPPASQSDSVRHEGTEYSKNIHVGKRSGPNRGHPCDICGKSFVSIRRHTREKHEPSKIPKIDCPVPGCERTGANGFTRGHNQKVHLRSVHKHAV